MLDSNNGIYSRWAKTDAGADVAAIMCNGDDVFKPCEYEVVNTVSEASF